MRWSIANDIIYKRLPYFNFIISVEQNMRKRILFSIIIFVFSFSVLEIISRIYVRTVLVQKTPSAIQKIMNDPILHHKWIPSKKIIEAPKDIPSFLIITNKQSWLEDYDVTIEKPDDTFRIFYLGDSTVQGLVNSPFRMVQIVEKKLNDKYKKQDMKFEVINTGTSSYSFLQYYLLIKTQLLKYSPDLIVINIDMTDVVNDACYRRLILVDEEGNPAAIPNHKTSLFVMSP